MLCKGRPVSGALRSAAVLLILIIVLTILLILIVLLILVVLFFLILVVLILVVLVVLVLIILIVHDGTSLKILFFRCVSFADMDSFAFFWQKYTWQ